LRREVYTDGSQRYSGLFFVTMYRIGRPASN
jgi:hypothetical protein